MADNSQATLMAEMAGGMYGPNQYSHYPSGVRFPPSYRGIPTDAMGNPIQPTPGMTLNNSAPAPAPAAAPQHIFNTTWAPGSGVGTTTRNPDFVQPQLTGGMTMNDIAAATQAANPSANFSTGMFTPGGGAPPSPQQPGDSSYQNALSLLSNPGHVTTPGATVPQSTIGNQPSVLQQFLANQKGGQGANTYSNQGFFDTLNKLGG